MWPDRSQVDISTNSNQFSEVLSLYRAHLLYPTRIQFENCILF